MMRPNRIATWMKRRGIPGLAAASGSKAFRPLRRGRLLASLLALVASPAALAGPVCKTEEAYRFAHVDVQIEVDRILRIARYAGPEDPRERLLLATDALRPLEILEHGDRTEARAANQRGLDALAAGRPKEALGALLLAFHADPADVEVVNNLAYVEMQLGLPATEARLYEALRLAPRRTNVWANLAMHYAQCGRADLGAGAFALAFAVSANPVKTLEFIKGLPAAHKGLKLDAAVEGFVAMPWISAAAGTPLPTGPLSRPRSLMQEAEGAVGRGDIGEALRKQQEAIGLFEAGGRDAPETIGAKELLALTYVRAGQWPEAEALLVETLAQRERLADDHPRSRIAALNLLSRIRRERGDPGQAAARRKEARTLVDQHREVMTGLALGVSRGLAEETEQLFRSEPKAETLLRWRRALSDTVELRQGLLPPDHPELIAALRLLGRGHRLWGDHEGAVKQLEEAVASRERAVGRERASLSGEMAELAVTESKANHGERAEALLRRGLAALGREGRPLCDSPLAAAVAEIYRAPSQVQQARALLEACPERLSVRFDPWEGLDRDVEARLGRIYFTGSGASQDPKEAIHWLRRAAERDHPDAQTLLGQAYRDGRGITADPAAAARWLQRAAEQGATEAQMSLGELYHDGKGLPQDHAKALFWYRAAADQGEAWAQARVGRQYLNGRGVARDEATAAAWYRKAAEQKNAYAEYILGKLYLEGSGVPKDAGEGLRWVLRGAEHGNAWAQTEVGDMYLAGRGVAQEPATAVGWYRRAAAQGHAAAQMQLGLLHRDGNGVARDLDQAVKWLRAASEQRHAPAQRELGHLYREGKGVPQDLARAAGLYRQAAEQGDAEGQLRIGIAHGTGAGVERDAGKASAWYRKAAEQGNAYAQLNLGRAYRNGHGVAKSETEAAQWIRRSAEQGVVTAQADLGWSYLNGRGLERDPAAALLWFTKAAEKGDVYSQAHLGYLYENGLGVNADREKALSWYRKAESQQLSRDGLRRLIALPPTGE